MSVEYLTTEKIWSDILTNPLQENPYQIMRSKLINMTKFYVDPGENSPVNGSKATVF